ncbi:hypothetical protein [Paenibacillus lemnae]|uniref:Uncharacterized protein n=1 Tax=Paenibacillus lemnae TaxID=1330551 RepID=A0A848M1H3_PAELE|nr:hypothetical protein [Paenibacillus lemnae]NMO94396.1 hypothetical protein [Paenibacillus lemnae]
MNNVNLVSHSKDPVITFASQEWTALQERFGLIPGQHPETPIHIDIWDAITLQTDAPHMQEALSKPGLMQDSYYIEILPERIILSGASPRAVLYAVYETYRQALGIHWIYPGENPAVSAPEKAQVMESEPSASENESGNPTKSRSLVTPLFKRRGFVIENLYDPAYIVDMVDWMAKNRANEIFFTFTLWDKIKDVAGPEIVKRGLELTLGGHSMKFFLKPQEADTSLSADHPYTAKQQLDYADLSWQETVFDQIAAYCREVPGLTRVSLWPEDLPAKQDGAFLEQYLAFTDRLANHLRLALPQLEVEHIAYNAGLAWDMLERSHVSGAKQADTLLAYWGRDYRHPIDSAPAGDDQRAIGALQDWLQEVHRHERTLTVFEYYSDHFMFSPLFPSIPSTIAADITFYQSIGVDGMTNLIVPCPGYPDYPWKWATGMNSYVFSRAVWGDDLAHILDDYYLYYQEEDRDLAQTWMQAIERHVTSVTAWNIPLFPGRVVDTARISEQEERRPQVSALLQEMNEELRKAYGSPSEALANSQAGTYIRHLITLSEQLESAWRGDAAAE